ncbi:MAG: ATP-binding cassette domain-containing protein [Microbacteriaceae bacterium]
MTPALEATGLSKRFGAHLALDDVGLVVPAGRTLGVVGESGSGKSTLGRILMHLTRPDAGEVRVEGAAFTAARGARLRALRKRIQLVPQDPRHSLNPTMTVRENLAFQLRAHRTARAEWVPRSVDALASVDLPGDYLNAYPHELSGGQAQRIAIARALLTRPAVLVCDEAVSALDRSVQASVLNTLAVLQRESRLALVFISHDLAVVEHLADELLVLSHGVAVEQGPTPEVLRAPAHEYTRRLLAARMHAPRSATAERKH